MNDSAPFESVRTPPNYMRFWSARHTPTKFSCQSSFHPPTFSCVLSRYYAVCLFSETCQAPRRYRFVFLVFRCCSGKIGLLKCDTRSLLYGIRLLRKMKTAGRVLVCRCCRRVSAQCELERRHPVPAPFVGPCSTNDGIILCRVMTYPHNAKRPELSLSPKGINVWRKLTGLPSQTTFAISRSCSWRSLTLVFLAEFPFKYTFYNFGCTKS